MLGAKLKDFHFKPRLDGYAIKVPVFSFDKCPNVDKCFEPAMKSTREEIYFIKNPRGAFRHCETRLCGARQRQVYGERSMYLSR